MKQNFHRNNLFYLLTRIKIIALKIILRRIICYVKMDPSIDNHEKKKKQF
jgi:hypothetical protein